MSGYDLNAIDTIHSARAPRRRALQEQIANHINANGFDNHVAGPDLAARGAEVESGWSKPFDLMEADMEFCGIDLLSNNSVLVVSDAEDRIVALKAVAHKLARASCCKLRE